MSAREFNLIKSDALSSVRNGYVLNSKMHEKWFHIHIPKTGGTSLNRMLAKAFGDDFAAHKKEAVASKRVTAGHISFYHIRKGCPECRLITILRDPVARLRSAMGHFYGRRNENKYRRVGHIIAAMRSTEFEADDYLMQHPLVLTQCDNVLTRYLCSSPVTAKVTEQHLIEAKTNVGLIDALILSDRFLEGAQCLWSRFLLPEPELRRENTSILKHRLFDKLPTKLEPYVRFDRELFAKAEQIYKAG